MLPAFHIRNLQPSLVRIDAPCYDESINSHPAATLKYYDEDDGDLITVGILLPESLSRFCADAGYTAWVIQRIDGEAERTCHTALIRPFGRLAAWSSIFRASCIRD